MLICFLKWVKSWYIAHEWYFLKYFNKFMLITLLVFLQLARQFVFTKAKGFNNFEVFGFNLKFWNEIQDKFILTSFLIKRQLVFLIIHEAIIHNFSLVFLSFLVMDIFESHDFVYSEINLDFSLSLGRYSAILYLMNLNFFTFHLTNLFEELMSLIPFQQ